MAACLLRGLHVVGVAIMRTSDAPFGLRHAIGCAAIIAATACALLLLCGGAQAQSVDCAPMRFNDLTGTSNAAGKWAAWRCQNGINVVACSSDQCTDAALNAAWWVATHAVDVAGANYALTKHQAASICAPAVKAVWWPDRYKLREQLGMSDAEIAAICR